MSFGPELVTDGGFPNFNNWTAGNEWISAKGLAIWNSNGGGNILRQFVPVLSMRTYRVEFLIQDTSSGTLRVTIGGGSWDYTSITGIKSVDVTLPSGPAEDNIIFTGLGPGSFNIDDVSVREILPDVGSLVNGGLINNSLTKSRLVN